MKQKLTYTFPKPDRKHSKNRAKMAQNGRLYTASKLRYNIVNKIQPRKNTLTGVESRTQTGVTLVGFEASRLKDTGGGPFLWNRKDYPRNKGGEYFMNDKPVYQCWGVYLTKLVIYENRIEIKRALGLSTQTIPMNKVASVSNTFMGIVFETSGGSKHQRLQPWDAKKKTEIVDIVLKLIDKK